MPSSPEHFAQDYGYPAAHSMDTTWYAVDADGQIAQFTSFEDGWVPAWWLFKPQEVTQFLNAEIENGEFLHDVEDYVVDQLPRDLVRAAGDRISLALLAGQGEHVHGQESVASLIQRIKCYDKMVGSPRVSSVSCWYIVTPSDFDIEGECIYQDSQGQIVLAATVPFETYTDLHGSAACVRCCADEDWQFLVGGFAYDFDNGRYERTESPGKHLSGRILNLHDLPASIRRLVSLVDLQGIRFAECDVLPDLPDEYLLKGSGDDFWHHTYPSDGSAVTIGPGDRTGQAGPVQTQRYRQAFPHIKKMAESRGLNALQPEDFPAAHSMDTHWFAVDAEGHVGAFNSGENSWVPAWWAYQTTEVITHLQKEAKAQNYGDFSLDDYVTRNLPADLAGATPDSFLANLQSLNYCHFHEREHHEKLSRFQQHMGNDATSDADDALVNFRAWKEKFRQSEIFDLLLVTHPGVALDGTGIYVTDDLLVHRVDEISVNRYSELHENGDCLGCYEDRVTQHFSFQTMGMYQYYGGDTDSAPYTRGSVPAEPVLLTALPPHLQNIVQLVQFGDLSFLDAMQIGDQPEFLSLNWNTKKCWEFDPSANTIRPASHKVNWFSRRALRRQYREAFPHLKKFAESRGYSIEPPKDYPAAHSMDTHWFAVDAEGNVGAFDSGENGWLPGWWVCQSPAVFQFLREEAQRLGEDCFSLTDYVCLELPTRIVAAAGDTFSANLRELELRHYHEVQFHHHIKPYQDYAAEQICSAKSRPVSQDPLSEFTANGQELVFDLLVITKPGVRPGTEIVFESTELQIIRIDEISLDEYRGLHDRGECLGCYEDSVSQEFTFQTLGMYQYYGSEVPGEPYLRADAPREPLLVSALPAGLQNIAALVQFDNLTFRDVKEIADQPQFLSTNRGRRRCWDYDHPANTIRPGQSKSESDAAAMQLQYRDLYPHLKKLADSRGFCIEPPEDFPAAHSGDVEWFATDRDGHVAHFNPWNSAPVPAIFDASSMWQAMVDAGCRGGDLGEFVSSMLITNGFRSEQMIDLNGAFSLFTAFAGFDYYGANRVCPGGSDHREQRVQDIRRENLGPVTVILRSLEPVCDAISAQRAKLEPQHPEPPPYVVRFNRLSRTLAEKILRSGECLACFSRQVGGNFDDESPVPGIFYYSDCDPEDGIRGPYFRSTVPVAPVTVDCIPERYRDFFKQVRFENLSFLDAPALQPLEHMKCTGGWDAYVDLDGRTVRSAPSAAKTDLAGYQQEWTREVFRIESRRRENLQTMVADWPDAARPATASGANEPATWFDRLCQQLAEFRRSSLQQISPDIVRVAGEFPSEEIAQIVYESAIEQTSFLGRPYLRGSRMIFLESDRETDWAWRGAPDSHAATWKWLNHQIQNGRFPEPRVGFGRPQVRPSGAEWKLLWDDLRDLRERQPEIMAGRIPPQRQERRRLRKAGAMEVRDTIVALLLSTIGPDFDFLSNYYCLLDYGDYLQAPMARVGHIVDLIDEVSAEDWQLLERIIAFLPLKPKYGFQTPVVQSLRLKVLSVLATSGKLNALEVRRSLRSVVEGREEPIDDLAVISEAFRLPGLPVTELKGTIRRVVAEVDATDFAFLDRPEDLDELMPILREVAE